MTKNMVSAYHCEICVNRLTMGQSQFNAHLHVSPIVSAFLLKGTLLLLVLTSII
jgi:hypothetical protein